MIDLCEERFGQAGCAHFSVGRLQKLHFPDDWFDVGLCMGVLEYVDDVSGAVAELIRVLKPGGLLVLSCLNHFSPYWVWDRLDKRIQALPQTHRVQSPRIRMFTAAAVGRLLRRYATVPTDLVYYSFNVVPPPLDREFPRRSVQLSKKLERLCGTHLRWLGMGFIIKGQKERTSTLGSGPPDAGSNV